MALFIVGICIYCTCLAAGLVALFFNLPGTLIILVSSITYGIVTRFHKLSIVVVVVILILYLVGEVFEEFLGAFGTKAFGASKRAFWAAFWGGIIGGIIGLPIGGIGAVLFGFLGVFLGPFLVELLSRRGFKQSVQSGTGGVLGKAGSIIIKELLAIIMVALAVCDLFLF